jgi:hypothetical protein
MVDVHYLHQNKLFEYTRMAFPMYYAMSSHNPKSAFVVIMEDFVDQVEMFSRWNTTRPQLI